MMLPGDVLDLSRWKVTLPTGRSLKPTEVKWPALAGYADSHFRVDGSHAGVVFTAPVDGFTTRGSKYPRCELREMNSDGSNASWMTTSGVHSITVVGAATEVPTNKSQQIIVQIHDADRMVVAVEIDGPRVVWKTTPGPFNSIGPYLLGDRYCCKIVVFNGVAAIHWNGELAGQHACPGAGCYFKAGTYCQSNLDYDSPPAASQAVIYELRVTHGP
jgi:Alginate lyase